MKRPKNLKIFEMFVNYDTNDTDILTSQFKDNVSIKKIKLRYPEIFPDTFTFTSSKAIPAICTHLFTLFN